MKLIKLKEPHMTNEELKVEIEIRSKNCNTCSVKLTPDNWYPSFVAKCHYSCTTCYDKRRIKNMVESNTASPFIVAKYIGGKALEEYNSVKSGHVYAISNPAWKGWLKIGMAVDAKERCRHFQTGSPLRDYKVEYFKYFIDRREAERMAHDSLKLDNIERQGEWFKIKLKEAKALILKLQDEQYEAA